MTDDTARAGLTDEDEAMLRTVSEMRATLVSLAEARNARPSGLLREALKEALDDAQKTKTTGDAYLTLRNGVHKALRDAALAAAEPGLDEEVIEGALTEFIWAQGSDFSADEYPAMHVIRTWSEKRAARLRDTGSDR